MVCMRQQGHDSFKRDLQGAADSIVELFVQLSASWRALLHTELHALQYFAHSRHCVQDDWHEAAGE